jgi:hypothetical protein
MADQIADFVDQIMSAAVDLSGDAARDQAPYYRFGEKWFETNEERPRQVRWQKLEFTTTPSQNITGSLGTFSQTLQCSIWGNDVDECLEDFQLITKAINKIKSSNVTGLNQTPIIQQGSSGFWADISARTVYGEKLYFNYDVSLSLPTTPVSYSLITSASITVSASLEVSGNISGSYQLGKAYTVTTASY